LAHQLDVSKIYNQGKISSTGCFTPIGVGCIAWKKHFHYFLDIYGYHTYCCVFRVQGCQIFFRPPCRYLVDIFLMSIFIDLILMSSSWKNKVNKTSNVRPQGLFCLVWYTEIFMKKTPFIFLCGPVLFSQFRKQVNV
jgi:hypothetical protein